MCRFCVEHGEGERWYLNAANYASDLESDLRRRAYIVDFMREFGDNRTRVLGLAERLDGLPAPLSRVGREMFSRHMQKHHFGQPVPIEECERILGMCTSITVIPCICRMHAPGKRAEEVCILVTTQPMEAILADGFADYENGPDLSDFNRVTRERAMELLRRCEERGLMHSVWTFQTPFTAAICNCNLESGCLAMQLTASRGLKMMWKGEWVARLDGDRCRSCGACAKVCPFGAITVNGRVAVRQAECWGCGVCRTSCRFEALDLVRRSDVPDVATSW